MSYLRPALVFLVLMALLTGIAYPYGITALAQMLFPYQANGSLMTRDGKIIGSELIGQNFTSDKYFHGRPSATTPPYNAANSGGSNLGPTNKALIDRVKTDAEKLHQENSRIIPSDLVTSSASGLDPDITVASAQFQVPRVAKARGMSELALSDLIDHMTQTRLLGFIGEPHVNVLKLNMALDGIKK